MAQIHEQMPERLDISPWITAPADLRPSLRGDLAADVAVVGAGAPVVEESHPAYTNLIGGVERKGATNLRVTAPALLTSR